MWHRSPLSLSHLASDPSRSTIIVSNPPTAGNTPMFWFPGPLLSSGRTLTTTVTLAGWGRTSIAGKEATTTTSKRQECCTQATNCFWRTNYSVYHHYGVWKSCIGRYISQWTQQAALGKKEQPSGIPSLCAISEGLSFVASLNRCVKQALD